MNRVGISMAVVAALALTTAGCVKKAREAKEHRALATKAMKDKRFADAAQEYGLSLAADPNQEPLYMKKAMAETQAGQYDNAAESLKATLKFKTDPAQQADVWKKVGQIYMKSPAIAKA